MMKIYVMRHGTTAWNEKGITKAEQITDLAKVVKC